MSSRCWPSCSGVARSVLVATAMRGRAPHLGQLGDEEAVAGSDLLVGREAHGDHVDLRPRGAHQVVEPLAQEGAGPVQAGGVDEDQLRVVAVDDAAHHVAGGLRLGRGDDDLLAHERVGQRRLARVGAPDERREAAAVALRRLVEGARRCDPGQVEVVVQLVVVLVVLVDLRRGPARRRRAIAGLVAARRSPPRSGQRRSRPRSARQSCLPPCPRARSVRGRPRAAGGRRWRASSPSRRSGWSGGRPRASGACGSRASARTRRPSRSSPRPRATRCPRPPRPARSARARAGPAR